MATLHSRPTKGYLDEVVTREAGQRDDMATRGLLWCQDKVLRLPLPIRCPAYHCTNLGRL